MDDIATRALKLAETEGITPAAAAERLRRQEAAKPVADPVAMPVKKAKEADAE